jgi:hypothetical protein
MYKIFLTYDIAEYGWVLITFTEFFLSFFFGF